MSIAHLYCPVLAKDSGNVLYIGVTGEAMLNPPWQPIMAHCDFHSKQLKYSFEEIFSLKFGQVGCKKKVFFSNKYCELLVHASFTKFTGPAKIFLNNIIIYLKKNCFVIFFGDKACREVN